MKHRFLLGIAAVTVVFLVVLAQEKKRSGRGPVDTILSGKVPAVEEKLSPTPTLAFAEMTIPYLRSQAYESSMGPLTAGYRENGYTAYTTSFLSMGFRINALLTKPDGPQPDAGWPAIVFLHGYIPARQYSTLGPQYRSYVDEIARNGFVVFKIDLRGHGNSEGDPGGGYFGSDYVVDTLSAYRALQTSGFVNSRAVGLWGHSMSGNTVLRALAAKPDIPAAVIWAGAVYTYTDMAAYRIRDASYVPSPTGTLSASRRRELMEKMGTPSAESPFWRQVAPTTYLSDLKGALAVYHAVDDPVVSIEYTRNLKRLLDQTSVVHEIIEYPTGGHNLTGTSFVQAMQRTVAFFKTHLL